MAHGTWRPRLHDDLKLQVIEGEAIVLDRANERIHQLNEVGTFILERCDGRRTEAEILAAVVDHFEVGEKRAAQDTSELLTQMKALEILL